MTKSVTPWSWRRMAAPIPAKPAPMMATETVMGNSSGHGFVGQFLRPGRGVAHHRDRDGAGDLHQRVGQPVVLGAAVDDLLAVPRDEPVHRHPVHEFASLTDTPEAAHGL